MKKYIKKQLAFRLYWSLAYTVAIYGRMLQVDSSTVPRRMKNRAFMRRMHFSFRALMLYCEFAADIPRELFYQGEPQELIDFLILKGFLNKSEGDLFFTLATIYGSHEYCLDEHEEEKIITMHAEPLYIFLKRVVDSNNPTLLSEMARKKRQTERWRFF